MTNSKLWHALVGVGLSFGAAAGCGRTGLDDDAAGLDDSLFDPFCDATWPPTKTLSPPPACVDPLGECADAGGAFRCMTVLEPHLCAGDPVASFCIDGEWRCRIGTEKSTSCRCWAPLPDGFVCTESGPMPADDGSE